MTRRVWILLGITACKVTKTVAPELGALRVEARTSGTDVDRDGFIVTVDTLATVVIPSNGSYQFEGITTGSHTIRLSGLSANCSSVGPLERTVQVSSETMTTVSYSVACVQAPLASKELLAYAHGNPVVDAGPPARDFRTRHQDRVDQ
jgi:hypothetical protein